MLWKFLKDVAWIFINTKFQLKLAREGVSHGGLGLLVLRGNSTFGYSKNS